MPLETNLSSSPYFDDYTETKDFYSVLFKPSVAVQARELNQLQTILQKQIERFGDHVFKSGTIISGVNFRYLPNYQYIKIADLQVDGQPVNPIAYKNLFVRNTANLVARVTESVAGFQQKDPDLTTLYLQYINSSNTGNTSTYANGQTLTVYSTDYPVFSVEVNNGGLNFSNSDGLLFVSALSVNPSSGSFSNGETITQATTGAQATIIGVNNSIIVNSLVLQIKPLNADLANTSANSAEWTFAPGYNVTGGSSGAVANVVSLVGSGASGVITTDSLGVVSDITIQSAGNNYIIAPHATIKPTNNTASISTLSLTSYNYKAQLTIANNSFTAPVGNGYAFATTEGIIYQKGYFLRVDPQVIVVDKYSSSPNNVVVGFKTTEATVNVFTDDSLYDNALNTTNFTAPGADRLKLVPELVTLSSANAAANVEFFTLVEFKNGEPYKENRNTVYNTLGKEFARRTNETSGDFVVDEFLVITKDQDTANVTHNTALVDPGLAYISGERIQSLKNTYLNVKKSTNSLTRINQLITANYGNYVRVKNLAGVFGFKTGATVSLRSSVTNLVGGLTFPTGTSITPSGSAIGTARMRSLVYESGEPGTADAVYRLYIFDIKMNAGFAFKNVKAFYYDGTNDGICDAVQEFNSSTSANETFLRDTDNNNLLFNTGLKAVKVANGVSFTYRTTDETASIAANGMLTLSLIASGEQFPYTADASLTSQQKEDLIVVPLANTQAAANLTGTVATLTTSNTLVGTSTTFTADLQVGDYILLSPNNTVSNVRRITGITNTTSLAVDANVSFANTTTKIKKFFPAFYPIPLSTRASRVANTGANNTTLKIHLNESLTAPVNAAVTYNIRRNNAVQSTKAVRRDSFVKLYTGNNAGSSTGPWCLGLPDAVRLKNVYLGNTAGDLDVTKHFYIDQGHDGNFYGQSYLVQKGTSTLGISNSQWLLVKLDNYTASAEGFLTVASYSVNDTLTLAASSNTVNTMEIPEVITADKKYFDLRDTFDFRPFVANTVSFANTVAGAAINPANTETFNSNDKLFPAPDSEITFDAEFYLSRADRIIAKKDGSFEVMEGAPVINDPRPPRKPADSVTLAIITTNPYPSLPMVLGNTNVTIASKSVGNESGEINTRINSYGAKVTTNQFEENSQSKSYNMADIGVLEKRINQLEYYVSLNLLETNVKDLIIPSSINPAINRFKNGFFVDNFDDYTVVDTTSKEFNATIEQSLSELHPRSKQYNLNLVFDRNDATTNSAIFAGKSLMLPYVEETLVEQELATSTVNSDGNKTNYGGSMSVSPGTFRLLARGEVQIIPDASGGGGGGGGGDRWLFGVLPGRGPGKIICTKLYELGLLSKEIYEADQAFGAQLVKTHPDIYNGYRAWAEIVVDWMSGRGPKMIPWLNDEDCSKAVQAWSTKWAVEIATPWAEYMAFKMGVLNKNNTTGQIIAMVGIPICKAVGVWQRVFGPSKKPAGFGKGTMLVLVFVLLKAIAKLGKLIEGNSSKVFQPEKSSDK